MPASFSANAFGDDLPTTYQVPKPLLDHLLEVYKQTAEVTPDVQAFVDHSRKYLAAHPLVRIDLTIGQGACVLRGDTFEEFVVYIGDPPAPPAQQAPSFYSVLGNFGR